MNTTSKSGWLLPKGVPGYKYHLYSEGRALCSKPSRQHKLIKDTNLSLNALPVCEQQAHKCLTCVKKERKLL